MKDKEAEVSECYGSSLFCVRSHFYIQAGSDFVKVQGQSHVSVLDACINLLIYIICFPQYLSGFDKMPTPHFMCNSPSCTGQYSPAFYLVFKFNAAVSYEVSKWKYWIESSS